MLEVGRGGERAAQDAFADGIHPRPYVYNELNNLLLNALCPAAPAGATSPSAGA